MCTVLPALEAAPVPAVVPEGTSVGGSGCEGLHGKRPGRRAQRREARRRRLCHSSGQGAPSQAGASEDPEEPYEFLPHHALSVPREAALGGAPTAGVPVTTIMLRHIPCRYTQGSLLRELDQLGFEGCYDFFYLPMDMRNKTSVGYAFINFVDEASAERFSSMMQDYRFQNHPSDKIAEVSPAHLQGLRRNVAHFARRSVLKAHDTKYRPIVLQHGFKRDFRELLEEFAKEEEQERAPARCNGGEAREAAATSCLSPLAVDFVPGATAFGSQAGAPMPAACPVADSGASAGSAAATLNPLAREFVPLVPPGLDQLMVGWHQAPPAAHAALQQAAQPKAPAQQPPEMDDARLCLEEAVADFLRRQHRERQLARAAEEEAQAEALQPPSAAQLRLSQQAAAPAEQPPPDSPLPVVTEIQRPGAGEQSAPWQLRSSARKLFPEPSPASARDWPTEAESGSEVQQCSGEDEEEGNWVQEAFGDLVKDLVPAVQALPSAGSGNWISQAFFALVEDEPVVMEQGNWVAEAFSKLVGATPPSHPNGALAIAGAHSPVAGKTGSGSWIAEAFGALVSGGATPVSRRPSAPEAELGPAPAREPQLGRIADALQALAAAAANSERKGEGPWVAEPGMPKSATATPRGMGDALRRLRALGGWAWVAFA
mmetsp:Transcript_33349/g.92171  ORF Transcript_33349/g.92171 Transcript_33349/m.92171 type:complete len:657 (-) Transcript_33349:168-2138(-)